MAPAIQNNWQNYIPIFSAIILAASGAFFGGFMTWRMNRSMKQIEFMLAFTKRFHDILAAIHKLAKRLDRQREDPCSPTPWADAHELYRQFFGLMYDEFYAYRRNLLDTQIFFQWMKWRTHDAAQNSTFSIGAMPYDIGWQNWARRAALGDDEFVTFLNQIHKCDRDTNRVRYVVLSWHPSWLRRLFVIGNYRIRIPEVILGFLIGIASMSVLIVVL